MTRFAYFGQQIVPIADAKVSVMTHAFNYGTGVFGGLRGYWNADAEQLYVFRPLDHFKRFLHSASLLRMELPYTPQSLTDIVTELLRTEGYRENCYIRPLAYKSTPTIAVRLHELDALADQGFQQHRLAGQRVGRHGEDGLGPAEGGSDARPQRLHEGAGGPRLQRRHRRAVGDEEGRHAVRVHDRIGRRRRAREAQVV